MQTIQEITLELWDNLNCAYSTACGISLYYGFEQESNTLSKALISFGGGIGERSICVSVTVALSALSVVYAKKGYKEDEIAKIAKSFKVNFSQGIVLTPSFSAFSNFNLLAFFPFKR